MKTVTLILGLSLATLAAQAQSTPQRHTYPLLAVSLNPQQEQARQQVIREHQARRQEAAAARPARKLVGLPGKRPHNAYRVSPPSAATTPERQSARARP